MTTSTPPYRFDRFELRPAQRLLLAGGEPVTVGARAFDLLLALIDIPDFGTPLRSIAGSVERIADSAPNAPDAETEPLIEASAGGNAGAASPGASKEEVRAHA